jgi:coenzyme F420-0:L-glutamate ligase/coenzyme F420-1:gamma-L-glutamate ligase
VTIELIPIEGLPEVEAGDDLAEMLEPALAAKATRDGDVVAITQKVVSKAEGRIVPGARRREWVERESVGVVGRRGELVIARTRHGFVCANAGIDASNVPDGFLTLLPEDPDASAERLQKDLSSRLRLSRLGIVITDTFGRPWREGVVDVAIGCAGVPALIDLRGTTDDHGKELETTILAIADAVAAAGGLVMTKTARVPAAIVRGLDAVIGDAPPGAARALVRAPEDDLFWETALASISSATSSSGLSTAMPVPREAVEEAVRAAAAEPGDHGWWFVALDSPAAKRRLLAATGATQRVALEAAVLIVVGLRRGTAATERDPLALLPAGAVIRSLILALHAQHVGWAWDPSTPLDEDAVRGALGLGEAWLPLGLVAAGRTAEAGASRPRPPLGRASVDWRD